MRFFSANSLLLLVCALSLRAADGPEPADNRLISPRGTFTLTQHYAGNWTTTLHFNKGAHADVPFTESYPWPAIFSVSPDEKWILQIQKSGSGDNISFLYTIDAARRLSPMDQPFGELAFAFVEHSTHVSFKDLYHTGIEFGAWDLKAGLLRVSVHGSSENQSGKGVDQVVLYDLKKHRFHLP